MSDHRHPLYYEERAKIEAALLILVLTGAGFALSQVSPIAPGHGVIVGVCAAVAIRFYLLLNRVDDMMDELRDGYGRDTGVVARDDQGHDFRTHISQLETSTGQCPDCGRYRVKHGPISSDGEKLPPEHGDHVCRDCARERGIDVKWPKPKRPRDMHKHGDGRDTEGGRDMTGEHPTDWGTWKCKDCQATTPGERAEPPAPEFCDCDDLCGELIFEEDQTP